MEKSNLSRRPPIDIEQFIDLILASAAHRSHEESQRKFGELLLQKYFVDIPKEYEGDPIAKEYLDNILCSVASAIRAFSVARDLFETKWEELREAKAREKSRAERLDQFSPFKPDGYWKKALLLIGGLGLVTVFLSGFQKYIGSLPWIVALILILVCLVVLFGMEIYVDYLRNRRLANVEKEFPENLINVWQEKTLKSYRTICKQFLLLAIKIREQYYPGLTTINGVKVYSNYQIDHIDVGIGKSNNDKLNPSELDEIVNRIIEQHFAFKMELLKTTLSKTKIN